MLSVDDKAVGIVFFLFGLEVHLNLLVLLLFAGIRVIKGRVLQDKPFFIILWWRDTDM